MAEDPQTSLRHASGNLDDTVENDIDRHLNRTFRHPSWIESKSQIRLLRLANRSNSAIPCEADLDLCNVSDLPSTEYAALSYCWGEARSRQDVRCITIHSQQFAVRTNLFDFLQSNAASDLRTPIYIDAICLDQRDVEERSNQVGLMSEIYRNASRTVVWLGSCPHEQESNMASLRDQLADLELRNCPWNTASLVGLSFLCSRVYWRRLWIVQELLLSKKVDIHCGDFIFDLTALVDLVSLPSTQQLLPESHDASWWDCWKIARPRNYAEQSAQEGEIRDGWQPAVRLIHNRVKWLARRTDAGNAMPPSSGLPFHEALTAFRYHQCRERKDKVYALLGLLDEEGRSMMWSDYNCSKYSVFEQAAVTCLVSRWKSSDISARIGSQNYADRQYCEMLASMLALHDLDVEFGISKATHGARSYMKEKDYAPGNTGQSVDLDEAHSQTIQQPLPRSHQSIGEGVGNGQCIFEQSLRLLRNELSSV